MTAIQPFRPHDFVYDPLFVVSGERDFYKQAMIARLTTAKFQICPIFVNMFSDLPTYPRKRLVMRRANYTPDFEQMKKKKEKFELSRVRRPEHVTKEVLGADRVKYFHCPIINLPDDSLPYLHFPTFKLQRVARKEAEEDNKKAKNKLIQTQYRESETQTIPWEPEYKIADGGDPEILKLDFLKWGAGLPAGVHEVLMIERARMKRAWERSMPSVIDAEGLERRKDIIAAMERDEWAFREKEIEDIQNLRLELLEQMLSELHENTKKRTEEKMKLFIEDKQAKKQEQLAKIKKRTERELRKLEMQHRGLSAKYHIMNIVDEHVDHKSELFGPLMRHGEHPKRWHQVIDEHLARYKAQFIGVEHFNTLPRWLNHATQIKGDIKLPGTRLCVRETKWTTPVLRQLHEELKNLRKTVPKRPCTLRIRIEKTISESSTPEIEGITDEEEDNYQATIFIQSVLRGRASQMLIYEGRDRCRELIRELRLTHSVQPEESVAIRQRQRFIMIQQKRENIRISKENKLKQQLDRVQGKIVGSLLDFLNKELRRLMEERRAHAMCLMNERNRQRAEAAEAGRRQKELRRRREHDEMFRQVTKVHQDTVDLYLQDIVTEDMAFASRREAEIYVKKLADTIDDATAKMEASVQVTEQEEFIANLVHHFVLPEVEKQIIRKQLIDKQKEKLKHVHDALYKEMECLPKWVVESSDLSDLVGTIPELKYLYENIEKQYDIISQKASSFSRFSSQGSAASMDSNISYIKPRIQSSTTQLPKVEVGRYDDEDTMSIASGIIPRGVESDLDLKPKLKEVIPDIMIYGIISPTPSELDETDQHETQPAEEETQEPGDQQNADTNEGDGEANQDNAEVTEAIPNIEENVEQSDAENVGNVKKEGSETQPPSHATKTQQDGDESSEGNEPPNDKDNGPSEDGQ